MTESLDAIYMQRSRYRVALRRAVAALSSAVETLEYARRTRDDFLSLLEEEANEEPTHRVTSP